MSTPAGILLIDKSLGDTSMHACRVVRARLRRGGAPKRVRVGHAGTLDPLATGLLVVMIGPYTRMCAALMDQPKDYTATIDLSATSETDDAEGPLQPIAGAVPPTTEGLAGALAALTGVIMQRPPAYSALKLGGRRAYDLARRGSPIPHDMPARPVRVDSITLLRYAWPTAEIAVTCGKGTYIRSLARDIGRGLGVGGYLAALRRTRVGDLRVADARTLGQLPDPLAQSDLTTFT
ncbi:MAG: tRNA pseudouridine(55) synthase TruB [Isosphaera sp.]|nr:tRNA pseudouridine(55) synthase TruB [Isosphaera sp.]